MLRAMREQPDASEPGSEELRQLRIVLVRPRGAANIGAAARAMKNCGVRDLVLVRPRARLAAAARMAVHAGDVLAAARVVDDLGAAVGDCRLVVGTTCRAGGYRGAAEDLDALVPVLRQAAAAGPVAVVFGPEDHGLSNDDLRHCPRLCTLDTDPAYASLNLAQAVLLVCWTLRRAVRAGAAPAGAPAEPAAFAELAGLEAHWRAVLDAIGFLNDQNPEHILHTLRALLGRAVPTAREVRVLRGIARQIGWAHGRAGGARRARRPAARQAAHG